MDRLLFGDNQFFGVNHLSDEKGRQLAIKFGRIEAIMDVLDYCQSLGINTFVCSTRPQIANITEFVRKNPSKYENFKISPTIPDVHKYNNALSELGILGTIKNFVPSNFVNFLSKGALSFIKKDFLSMLKVLIDSEMQMFRSINVDVIYLQNNVTDLLLGLEMKSVFKSFADYIRKKYHAEPGFMTMNVPRLVEFIEYAQIENPVICGSINKIGFRMFGGKEKYEEVLKTKKYRYVAMQPLAAGAIAPKEAFEYLVQFDNIVSILFGSSSKAHILETKRIIEELDNNK